MYIQTFVFHACLLFDSALWEINSRTAKSKLVQTVDNPASVCVSFSRPVYSVSVFLVLLPTRSEEREVLGIGSIPVAILPSCQDVTDIGFFLHLNM